MTSVIESIIDYIWNVFNLVNSRLSFELFGYQVQFFSLILAGIVLVMLLSVFWKGVKG